MWEVDNYTKYAHAHSWDRDRSGADTWIVIVKGTFLILPDGTTAVAEEQPPVCEVPQYFGAPGLSSLRIDTDLIRVKPSTDVLVLGHAYAPNGRRATQVDVTLRTSAFEKTLRVFGDRVWARGPLGLNLSSPEPFLKMPLVYERAAGGVDRTTVNSANVFWDERNPVGAGFASDPVDLANQKAPNIEYPNDPTSSPRKAVRPAGFGPIGAHWVPRRRWAGTYDARWERERKPLTPEDLDDRFYLCAPEDQQLPAHLTGGETIELRNMTPEGTLTFRLPRVVLGFETVFDTDEPVLHRQVLHTVRIEPDVPRVSLVWQTSLQCHGRVLKLDHTRVTEKIRIAADRMSDRVATA
jgi:hypothetical protein